MNIILNFQFLYKNILFIIYMNIIKYIINLNLFLSSINKNYIQKNYLNKIEKDYELSVFEQIILTIHN